MVERAYAGESVNESQKQLLTLGLGWAGGLGLVFAKQKSEMEGRSITPIVLKAY